MTTATQVMLTLITVFFSFEFVPCRFYSLNYCKTNHGPYSIFGIANVNKVSLIDIEKAFKFPSLY